MKITHTGTEVLPNMRYGRPATSLSHEELLNRVSELHLICGYSASAIGCIIGRTTQSVAQMLKELKEQYVERRITDRQELIDQKKAQFAVIRQQAFDQWLRSQRTGRKTVVEGIPAPKVTNDTQSTEVDSSDGDYSNTRPMLNVFDADAELNAEQQDRDLERAINSNDLTEGMILCKQIVTRERRLGDPKYLAIIMKTFDAEIKLDGLNAPKKVEVGTKRDQVDWDHELTSHNEKLKQQYEPFRQLESLPPVKQGEDVG